MNPLIGIPATFLALLFTSAMCKRAVEATAWWKRRQVIRRVSRMQSRAGCWRNL